MNEENDEVIMKMNQIKKTLGIHKDLVTPQKVTSEQTEYIITTEGNQGLEKELWELKKHLNEAKREVNEL